MNITKNSVVAIRNKSYWNYNNLNPKDPVAMGLFLQKDLIDAIEKAERRNKKGKKKRMIKKNQNFKIEMIYNRQVNFKVLINYFFGGCY